jgi:Fe-S cluster assembly protein SufD
MTAELKPSLSLEAVEVLAQRNGEPQWMGDLRRSAWETYEATPMPAITDEEWRRTQPQLRKINFDVLKIPELNGAVPLPPAWQPSAETLRSRDGFLVSHVSTPAFRTLSQHVAAKGVIFTDMDTAVREHGDLVRAAFTTEAVKPEFSKFAALNGALWSGGTFVYVPDGVKVDLPLQASTWLDKPGLGAFPHSLVVMGRNSEATFVDETGSQGADETLSVPVVELILHEGSKLTFVTLQELDDTVRQVGVHRAIQHKNSSLTWITATMGGRLVKLNIDTEMRESGSTSEILGLYFVSGSEFIDYHTLQDHIAPNTTSNLLFKGVLRDSSRVVYSGLIRVHESAQKTDAYQKNNNLILSPSARADSIPNLEIAANDVRCSHGATAGKVSEDHLFYLMSRGLSRGEAERLIVNGFLAPLIERIPLEDVRERLTAQVDAKMAAGAADRT